MNANHQVFVGQHMTLALDRGKKKRGTFSVPRIRRLGYEILVVNTALDNYHAKSGVGKGVLRIQRQLKRLKYSSLTVSLFQPPPSNLATKTLR
jgi:hypothetical protein